MSSTPANLTSAIRPWGRMLSIFRLRPPDGERYSLPAGRRKSTPSHQSSILISPRTPWVVTARPASRYCCMAPPFMPKPPPGSRMRTDGGTRKGRPARADGPGNGSVDLDKDLFIDPHGGGAHDHANGRGDAALLADDAAHISFCHAPVVGDGAGLTRGVHRYLDGVLVLHEAAGDSQQQLRHVTALRLQSLGLLEQVPDGVGGLGAVGDPGLGLRCVDLDLGGLTHGIVGADLLDETAVAGEAAVGHHHTVERGLLGAHTAQSDLHCHNCFLLKMGLCGPGRAGRCRMSKPCRLCGSRICTKVVVQRRPPSIPPSLRAKPLGLLRICFIIFCIISYWRSRRLTSSTRVPLPAAIRRLRLGLMMEGFSRSSLVME